MSGMNEDQLNEISARPETLEEAIDRLIDLEMQVETAESAASMANAKIKTLTEEVRLLQSRLGEVASTVRKLVAAIPKPVIRR